jgi:hypothetical protein
LLTADDIPTIEWAIRRRLDTEPGAFVFIPILAQPYAKGEWYLPNPEVEIYAQAGEPFIRVGVMIKLGETILLRSKFDLPDPFEHGHLLNEVDQLAEQCKQARKGFFTSGLTKRERKLPGTGLRGGWDRYGMLMGRHG